MNFLILSYIEIHKVLDECFKCLFLGLASKVKRSDSLALKLGARPSKAELEGKNIIPSRC